MKRYGVQSPHSRLRRLLREEKGLTLVELLLVLAVGSMIIMLVHTILAASLNSWSRVNQESNLRNETNYLMERLENAMLNTATVIPVEPIDADGHFTSFTIVSKTNPASPVTVALPLDPAGGSNLTIGGTVMNKTAVSVAGSFFELVNGTLRITLQVQLEGSSIPPMFIYSSEDIGN